MPSYFDKLLKRTFDKARGRFGYDATYVSADGLVTWEGIVLFRNPAASMKLAGIDYDPSRYEMEYRIGDLPGLLERVNARGSDERVTIDGNEYHVRAIDAVKDGNTFRATLIPVAE